MILFLLSSILVLQGVVCDEDVALELEGPARTGPVDDSGNAMEEPPYDELDTEGLVWSEPISEAEIERSRGLVGEPPSNETMELVRRGLENEHHGRKDGRSIQRALSARWPNGKVPYKIENTFSYQHRQVIASGFANIQDNTCIEFVPYKWGDEDWMDITSTGATGCSATARFMGPGHGKHNVGLQIGNQWSTCVTKGVVVHELLHILGVAHEQQRPDRDQYLTMNWPNIQIAMAYNMWQDSWETDDVDNLKKCNDDGMYQSNAYFGDCVSGDTVTDFGVGYDFKSVMHYGLKSFAVNQNEWVMYPKDTSLREEDVGGEELSPMDIRKLNYGYYCDGTTKSKCGGSFYSESGGTVDGTLLPGTVGSTCESLFHTRTKGGIELNLDVKFGGDCWNDYLEVRVGGRKGPLVGKYCKGSEMPSSLKVPTQGLWMAWKKTSAGSSMSGTWTPYDVECCDKMIVNIPERTSFSGEWTKTASMSGGRNVYTNGEKYIAWNVGFKYWGVMDEFPSDSAYAKNKMNWFCPTELASDWLVYKNKAMTPVEGSARCSDCDRYPQYEECALCCDQVTAVTSNSYVSDFFLLGTYSLYTSRPEHNGKKVYSWDKDSRYCLWSKLDGTWMLGKCTNIGYTNGYGFGDDSKCVRKSGGWQLAINGALYTDSTFGFTCANPPTRKPVATTTTTTRAPPATQPPATRPPPTLPPATTAGQGGRTTYAPQLCPECKTIEEGAMKGVYLLQSYGDPRCADGCVYYKDNKIYCFQDGGPDVTLQCPATNLF